MLDVMGLAVIPCLSLLCAAVAGYNLDTSFPIIYRTKPGNYFGYTVALHKNKNGPLALIGAPRANSSVVPGNIHQPGVLFKCNVPTSSTVSMCSEVVLDTKGNERTVKGSEFSYYDKKDDMWLGVSLDVQQGTSNNHIVTCGHLWKNQYYKGYHLANGVCYVIDEDLDSRSVLKIPPLVERSKQAIIPPGIYLYAFAQTGTSAAFSEDGRHLILGAPGIYDWAGGVVSYSSDTAYTYPIVPEPTDTSSESYLGYSVTSGKFFDENALYYAVGAPRQKLHGMVHIFKEFEKKTKQLTVRQRKAGRQVGEYFGGSVLGVNLNGDEFTDLLIGAPTYSSDDGGDEGRVFVYISNGLGLQTFVELMGDSKPKSRFGTSLANVGDLNQDGFNDVAVGAPYEDGHGAIYIYHGSEVGMKIPYVQKVEAANLDSHLYGFGIHVSRGLDIDDNMYPDILVGSYASSSAVLLRTRPVIELYPRMAFSPQRIDLDGLNCEYAGKTLPCVNVSACLLYSGKHAEDQLDFYYEVQVEPPGFSNVVRPRGFFVEYEQRSSVFRERLTLNNEIELCKTRTFYLHPDIKDVVTPIKFMFEYRLANSDATIHYFDKSFPVVHPSNPTNITSQVPFEIGCGSEDECHSNLIVSGTLLGEAENGRLLLGKTPSISLSVTVKNKGEPAYMSELLIRVPPDLPVINQDFCESSSQSNNLHLTCDLGNPLPENGEINILIKLDGTKVRADRNNLEILLEARTISTEVAPEDNNVLMPLKFLGLSDISITGIPYQSQIILDRGDSSANMIQIYHIRNHGPSPIELIDILLLVPMYFIGPDGKMQFLTLTDLEVDTGKQITIPVKCNDTYTNLGNVPTEPNIREKDAVSVELSEPNGMRIASTHNSSNDVERKNVLINCDSEDVECAAIQCFASPFTDIRKLAVITMMARVDIDVLNKYLGPWSSIQLVTSGTVSVRDSDVELVNNFPDTSQLNTEFLYKRGRQARKVIRKEL